MPEAQPATGEGNGTNCTVDADQLDDTLTDDPRTGAAGGTAHNATVKVEEN